MRPRSKARLRPLSRARGSPAGGAAGGRFLAASRQAGDPLSNVAAILRAEVPAATIDATPGLVEFTARLRAARETAARRGAAPPVHVPVLTAAELALVKPGLTVRTQAGFRWLVLRWTAFYFAGFAAVSRVWRLRRGRGDGSCSRRAAAHGPRVRRDSGAGGSAPRYLLFSRFSVGGAARAGRGRGLLAGPLRRTSLRCV